MISRLAICALAWLFFPHGACYAQDAFPLGVWTDRHNKMVVRITPCDGSATTFCGTVVQDNRRGRPTNPPGHLVIRGLAPAPTHWSGQAYDGTVRLHFTLHPTADDSAQARLCIVGILCLNERVRRISNLVAR
jgi:uncharacterized protein (DUF2147 family)